jgi:hypothetical protein
VVTVQALQDLWAGFLNFIPKLIGSVIIFIVGWFLAIWIGKLVAEVLKRLKFDSLFSKTKWEEAMGKADVKMKMSGFIGMITKWILVIVFLSVAVEILGLSQFSGFIKEIVAWLPNVIVAAAIFVAAVIISDLAEKMIRTVVQKMNVGYAGMAGAIAHWAIWIFAAFAILGQLDVATEITQILMAGIVALVVVSASIAFGIGGKDLARDLLESARKKMRD